MVLRLYNTLSRSKEGFAPIDDRCVRLYVCGPTVYDRAHIGNARPLILFDVLFRLLRAIYGAEHVVYVRNLTDVDDKINARAAERGIDIRTLTDDTAAEFAADVAGLECLPPTHEPRATDHIPGMIAIIERLIERGHAYAEDGHVLFDVPSMPDYGRLSRRPLDDMIAGARVDVAPYKRNDADFVLWKPSRATDPGWPSPWGRGRPGWHIECSAMSRHFLGEVFDIHGGGIDLVFPHHENELAQTRCAFGHDVMANIWMHNGFLQVEGQKMSKSLDNFITIHDLLDSDTFGGRRWRGEVLRLAMLRTHYRQPIDWTLHALEDAERTLDRWYAALGDDGFEPGEPIPSGVLDALSDDLNTPLALAELHRLVGSGNTVAARQAAAALGLLQRSAMAWFSSSTDEANLDVAAVERLIAERLAARKAKNWGESDRIRDALSALGVAIKDGKDGTSTWTRARRDLAS